MSAVKARYESGQIVLSELVDWPEGTELRVEPLPSNKNGEDAHGLLGDDPESIARWLEWYDSVEPLIFTPEEEADIAAWRLKVKEHTIQTMNRDVEGLFQ